MSAKIISIAIQKGGTGKTTTAYALGTGLKKYGMKVLLVDIDPQANLTLGLGHHDSLNTVPKTLYEAIWAVSKEQDYDVKGIIRQTSAGVDLLPSTKHLGASDHELIQVDNRQLVLKSILDQVKEDYDIIIIDTPPKIDNLTINALSASDYYLIPLNAEYFAASGLELLVDTADRVKEHFNPGLECLGVVMNRFNPHKIAMRNMATFAENRLGNLIFQGHIRENVALMEAQMVNQSIFDYMPDSNGAKDFDALTQEVMARLQIPVKTS
ncbi:MAG: ParA family protein [Bacteroidetes bacterium]|nr:ParA family protein [Bacteroidota bacterium]MCB0844072.1 ParA family protein [Bacteroidota bacterium]